MRPQPHRVVVGDAVHEREDSAAMIVEPGDSVGLLVERTEGWPAGTASDRSMHHNRSSVDPDRGVRAFAGSARHVADYLTEEVLR